MMRWPYCLYATVFIRPTETSQIASRHILCFFVSRIRFYNGNNYNDNNLTQTVVVEVIIMITRITGTAHTSAKARLTSIAISVPPSGESVLDRHRNLIIRSLTHCLPSLKISCKSVRRFLRKIVNRQRNKQTNKQQRKHKA